MSDKEKICEKCNHCGNKLSPWQQVLLSVDRALMCKNCWYRIYLGKNGELKTSGDALMKEEEK